MLVMTPTQSQLWLMIGDWRCHRWRPGTAGSPVPSECLQGVRSGWSHAALRHADTHNTTTLRQLYMPLSVAWVELLIKSCFACVACCRQTIEMMVEVTGEKAVLTSHSYGEK